jgi:hypothetical protein
VQLRELAVQTLPPAVKRGLLRRRENVIDAAIGARRALGRAGTLPHFIIIGGQKCGTTYLYDRLIEHPRIRACLFEPLNDGEIHYFHRRYRKGLDWYRANFPEVSSVANGEGPVTTVSGEASGYLFYPHAPERITREAPDAKLIALLRNPIDRAVSHYHHEVRLGFETLSLRDALQREPERLRGETARVLRDPEYFSFARNHYSYLARGFYADQLPWWWEHFPREQLLVIQSEAFYRDPVTTLRRVTEFLELEDWQPEPYRGHKSYGYGRLAPETRQKLADHFREANQRLFQLLGTDYDWDN